MQKDFTMKILLSIQFLNFCDDNFWRGKGNKKPEKVIIDELPLVLGQILGCSCKMATMTGKICNGV